MMPSFQADQLVPFILHTLQASFSSATRLYDLSIEGVQEAAAPGAIGPPQTFMVEAYLGAEQLHTTSQWDILVLSTDAHIALHTLLGKTCQLHTALSDGSRTTTTGLINQAALLGSEGGLARYKLHVVDWTWMLGQSMASRVWQDTSVLDIVGSIFQRYAPQAAWSVSDEVGPFLAQAHNASNRSYCVQFRETDLAFVRRLLAEEGLSWRIEEHAGSPAKHRMVIFANSSQPGTFPEDYASAHTLGGTGIRFHRGSAKEAQDSFQALASLRSLPSAIVTLLTTDYKTKASLSASARTATPYGGKNAPQLESYLPSAPYGVGNRAAAQRHVELRQQALEARHERYSARGTVRSLRAGSHFTLTQAPLAVFNDPNHAGLNVLAVSHLGINNLPKPAQQGIAELLGDVPQLLLGLWADLHTQQASSPEEYCASSYHNSSEHLNPSSALPLQPAALLAQAQALGYANQCELITASVPWRPLLADAAGSGTRLLAQATAPGAQSAWVVGPDGTQSDTSAGDLYTDALGRVRIRFTWQGSLGDADGATSGTASCWVRVAQRSAGAGMGLQFLPRVGQEVLVQFLGGDMDRPIVVGALYNGQGDGGVAPTPAGAPASGDTGSSTSNPFAAAHDSRSSGQGNRMAADTGGHSPAWFGSVHGKHGESEASTSAGGHANSAAQWGIRTQEWGSSGSGGGASAGYNQLVFDDNDTGGGNQQRIHLKTSQYASELSLGHLVHTADNHRGSLRGQGFELRTDAYGAIRGGAGLHLSTYPISHSANSRDPAGDNAAALSLLKQAKVLSEAFSKAAGTHASVKLAVHEGSIEQAKSAIDDQAGPLQALYKASASQVSTKGLEAAYADAPQKATAPDASKLPHSGEPILSLAGKGGIALVAGQSLQWSNSETVSLMSGQDSQSITGGQFRLHSGQAIGILAGAVDKGEAGKGLTLIASKDPVRYEAQSNEIKIQAKQLINIQSANAHIDWAAAKKISLSTAGGANITIEGGNITVQCPGKLTVHAASKTFEGPISMPYPLPVMPTSEPKPIKFALKLQDIPGDYGVAPEGESWKIIVSDIRADGGATPPEIFDEENWRETLFSGTVGGSGEIKLNTKEQEKLFQRLSMQPGRIWLVSGLTAMALKPSLWSSKNNSPAAEKILDALNFAPDGRALDKTKRDWLQELAMSDADVKGINALKPKTDA